MLLFEYYIKFLRRSGNLRSASVSVNHEASASERTNSKKVLLQVLINICTLQIFYTDNKKKWKQKF